MTNHLFDVFFPALYETGVNFGFLLILFCLLLLYIGRLEAINGCKITSFVVPALTTTSSHHRVSSLVKCNCVT